MRDTIKLDADRAAVRDEFSDNPDQMAREIEALRRRLIQCGQADINPYGHFRLKPCTNKP